jgi:hypothetical protein
MSNQGMAARGAENSQEDRYPISMFMRFASPAHDRITR